MIVSYDTMNGMDTNVCSFQLTGPIVNALTSIAEMIGKLDGVNLAKPNPKLRRKNQIQTIQSSLAIEGNSLTYEQVTALLDGNRVVGPKQDVLEVKNAIVAYGQLMGFDPFSLSSFLKAHRIMMKGLIPAPGKLREQAIGMIREKNIFHEAPHWKRVTAMMQNLFDYLLKSDDHRLLKSCRFHYQLEFIHPFVDGNGRMGRLWQTRVLMEYHPIFEFLPVEHLIQEHQSDYYQNLALGDDTGDCTEFIYFMLLQIKESLKLLLEATRSVTLTVMDRLRRAAHVFNKEYFSRKEYQVLHKNISPATASRDLQHGVKTGLLQRSGDKRTAVYRFTY
jgi:cell filamentation protein, protein adenylyltransferase